MTMINQFYSLNSYIYFDLCAFILFLGLLVAILQRKYVTNSANKILFKELLIGTILSFVSFICNISSIVFTATSINYFIVSFFKYVNCFLLVVLFQTNSFYFYFSSGCEYIIRRHKILYAANIIIFLIPVFFILSNIFYHQIFTVGTDLSVISEKYNFMIYIFLIIIMLKDVLTLLCLHKYFSNKLQFLLIIPYLIVIYFLILKCINPAMNQELFIFSVYIFINVSYAQRQDLMINPLFNAFSAHAFFAQTESILAMTSKASVCFIKIHNYKNLKLYIGQEAYVDLLKRISEIIKNILVVYKIYGSVYYLGHGLYGVIIPGYSSFKKQRFYTEINNIFQQELSVKDFKILCDSQLCIAEIPADIKSNDYIHEFTKKIDHVIPKSASIIYISEIAKKRDFQIKNHMKQIISDAITNRNFEVYYHPIYSVIENNYISAEALIRINDPTYGLILPDLFIPYAEYNGYIKFIDDFVFEEVCKFISSKEFADSNLKYISMNLSASQCLDSGFIKKITNIMQKYNVTTNEIMFEITEYTMSFHTESIERRIHEINDMGIRFSLDGYGTGYSNMKKLVSLPFEIVKLDRNFVSKYTNPEIKVVIESTIKMFKNLNKQVLVEGIETEGLQKSFVNFNCDILQGCEYLQGYYYSEPLSQSEFINFLQNNKLDIK